MRRYLNCTRRYRMRNMRVTEAHLTEDRCPNCGEDVAEVTYEVTVIESLAPVKVFTVRACEDTEGCGWFQDVAS